MNLFLAERHEPLTDATWNEAAARAAIANIVADAHAFFSPDLFWRIHPLDVSPERAAGALKPMYYGAAGVIWTLDYLQPHGAADAARDYVPYLDDLLTRHRADAQQLQSARDPSFGVGDTGILLLHHKLAPTIELSNALHGAIEDNINQPAMGLMLGTPGTMLAALFMFERTGDARWREQYLRSADAVWQVWTYIDEIGCHLWTQHLYGYVDLQIGALHGFAGNAFSMLRGQHLFTPTQRAELHRRIENTLRVTALADGLFVNWPKIAGSSTRPGASALLLQHCSGAPGVINCLAGTQVGGNEPIERLLHAAGELIWSAGPLRKIPSLCHGTPGNGYAFLKLFACTGDEVWLQRARRFAMHAMAQNNLALAEHGQRKYSLWTGDLGLAVFLHDCVRGVGVMPMLDVF